MPDAPLPSSRFAVSWQDQPVERVRKVSGLKRSVAVITHRDGTGNVESKLPGQVEHPPVTIERALSTDGRFREFANAAAEGSSGFRRDVVIDVLDESGAPTLRCRLRRAWVAEYEVFAELNVDGDAAAVERLVLEHEGWEVEVIPAGSTSPPSTTS